MNRSKWLMAGALCLASISGAVYAQAADAVKALPKVIVLSTGGTIAGESRSSTDTTNYTAGQRSGDQLVKAVPEIAKLANVEVEQVVNISSPNMQYSHLLALSKAASKYLTDPSVSGVVITHGTSTAEETAIFTDLTVKSSKPVIVVGAMRPATAISADGPFNLLQAIALAVHPSARDRGTLLVSNDRISSAMYVSKTNTQSLDTFQAAEQGHLGLMVGTKPYFYFTPASAPGKPYFDVSKTESLPKVEILYGYIENDAGMLDYLVQNGTKGVVVAGPGNSSLSKAMVQRITKLHDDGYPVVRATRVGDGIVTPKKEGIAAGFYNPQKARLLLALAINEGADQKKIQKYFLPY